MTNMDRRALLEKSSRVVRAAAIGLPAIDSLASVESPSPQPKLKVVVIGGHVDDPQAGCGGTMAIYANHGHEVVALSLTHGDSEIIAAELRIPNKELAAKRSADAIRSCALLKARLVFMNQINAHTEVSPSRYKEFAEVLFAEQPDIVFTHWPIDSHRDHRTASLLTYDAWLESRKKFLLCYYEVESGHQTQNFWPNHYVDITEAETQKREACFANTLTIRDWWPLHEAMQTFRGMESGCKVAEAFVDHVQNRWREPRALPAV